ncbi:hypothetical protein CLU83_2238 [Flavobacterium sp. 1]|nr:hypothetical protein CLU83_2238 [Flavobacterium sp. 1]
MAKINSVLIFAKPEIYIELFNPSVYKNSEQE